MNLENLKQLIVNLRRGDDVENSKDLFFTEIKKNAHIWAGNLDLRWLISVVDTYADHGTKIERSNALIVSTFANMLKISDTRLLLTAKDETLLPRLKQDVVYMYDGMNSLKITWDDMPNILWYRIDEVMNDTPEIQLFFEEIKLRFRNHSKTLQISKYYPAFWEKIFFEGRRNWRGV